MPNALDAKAGELDEKTKVIAHLTKTLAHTRNCLEIARAALESIAGHDDKSALGEGHAHCREIALNALKQI